jgi:hypothetical protein
MLCSLSLYTVHLFMFIGGGRENEIINTEYNVRCDRNTLRGPNRGYGW